MRISTSHARFTGTDAWCSHHTDGPCTWCGVPNGSGPCRRCRADAVTTQTQAIASLHHIESAMQARGVVLRRRITVVLSDDRTHGSPAAGHPGADHFGALRSAVDHRGRPVGDMAIAVTRGMPDALFRAVLAHQYAHAFLGTSPSTVPVSDVHSEGFAEAFAYTHLEFDYATDDARRHMRRMLANPDPVHSDGLRLVLPALRRHGAATVARALAVGDLASVGLSGGAAERRHSAPMAG